MIDKIKYVLAIILGKLIYYYLSFFKQGATAAPGLYGLKIDPNLLKKLAHQLKFSIVITGTNGKTTTSRILAGILTQAGLSFYHNRTGSNLLRGITSELLKQVNLKGLPANKIGLWEIDEAVLPLAINHLKPKIVVITNLFRDQLDRYGEIDTLAKLWKKALKTLPKQSIVILNADDPTVANLGTELKAKVYYFSIKDSLMATASLSHAVDATICPFCSSFLNYQSCFVSHLGIYNCPHCGSIQPQADIKAIKINFNGSTSTNIKIRNNHNQISNIKINLLGLYNVYNVLAAFSVAQILKINIKDVNQGITDFKPAFGRFENIKIKNKNLKILLVKNPTGFNQVITTLTLLSQNKPFSCLLLLNDKIADGRDVSWIWDVDFSHLAKLNNLDQIIVSGTRAEDLGLRLKYENINNFILEKNLKSAIKKLLNLKTNQLFVLPTYTAMLDLRQILTKMNFIHSTWKD